jgi:hypothetical protein
MHEGLITRGQIRGHAMNDFIYNRCNCLIRCHENPKCVHTSGTGGNKGFAISAAHLVEHEGVYAVWNWLANARAIFPIVGRDALQRFESLGYVRHPRYIVLDL